MVGKSYDKRKSRRERTISAAIGRNSAMEDCGQTRHEKQQPEWLRYATGGLTHGGRPPVGWRLGRRYNYQLSRPVRPVRCRRNRISNRGRPRQSQVPVFLMLMRDLHSQATLGWLASRAEMAQPVEHTQHDRRETNPCIGGSDGPGGVESSISTLLSA